MSQATTLMSHRGSDASGTRFCENEHRLGNQSSGDTLSSVLRPICAIKATDIKPGIVSTELPQITWIEPSKLCIEECYQRDLSERSIKLIRKIIQDWDWRKMKPPICARAADGKLFIVDGQHTAIAAASHPGVSLIPILVFEGLTRWSALQLSSATTATGFR